MNRALRAAALGMLLVSVAALPACSSGQVNQTSSQVRDKTGAQAQIGDIRLTAVQLAYPTRGFYQPGDDAELQAAIVNTGGTPDTLLSITGPDFTQVRITGSPTGTASPMPTGSTGTGSTATGARTTVAIPANTSVILGQTGPTVTLAGLTRALTPAETVPLTFTFQAAGSVTVPALVAAPASAVPQTSTFNFEPPTEAGQSGG